MITLLRSTKNPDSQLLTTNKNLYSAFYISHQHESTLGYVYIYIYIQYICIYMLSAFKSNCFYCWQTKKSKFLTKKNLPKKIEILTKRLCSCEVKAVWSACPRSPRLGWRSWKADSGSRGSCVKQSFYGNTSTLKVGCNHVLLHILMIEIYDRCTDVPFKCWYGCTDFECIEYDIIS